MARCDRHGYYSDEEDNIGVGCPICAQEDDERFQADAFHSETHCQLCKQPLPADEDQVWHRYTIHEQYGGPDDWENPHDYELHFCPECFEKKIKPLLEVLTGG